MPPLTRLHLFVHPMPRRASTRDEFMAKWEELIRTDGPREDCALCILSNAPKEMALLLETAKAHFGERCIVDPNDDSKDTKVLLADDLTRTLSQRGNYADWLPYEIWTSNNARRWTEGLKKDLAALGFTYDPDALEMVTCGQQWGGCLTKYSMFMSRYLGLSKAPDKRADLSPDAGFPVQAVFRERVAMADHVYLFLFERNDGNPMGQFMDGMRAVWEHPHIATVKIDPKSIELLTTSPNGYIKTDEAARVLPEGIVADVGDGCQPAISTITGLRMDYGEFRDALASATISPRRDRRGVMYHPGYLDPMTMSRGEE